MDLRQIHVIGSGVIGLTTALKLIEDGISPKLISIFSKGKGRETTSVGAGALYDCPPSFVENVNYSTTLALKTLPYLQRIIKEHDDSGIHIVPNISLSSSEIEKNPIQEMLPNFENSLKILDKTCCQVLSSQLEIRDMTYFDTPIADMPVYLSWLENRLNSYGVKIQQKEISSLMDILSKDSIVVNCTGLGAYQFVPDPTCYPRKGQVVRVHAPWIKAAFCFEHTYIIPRVGGDCICGGTKVDHDWDQTVQKEVTTDILQRCTLLVPSISQAPILEEWVGLRPQRSEGIRIETEILPSGIVVHNYGHGGAGFSCSWGSAEYVSKLIQEASHKDFSSVEQS